MTGVLADIYQLDRHTKDHNGCFIMSAELQQKMEDVIEHYNKKKSAHHDDLELLSMLEHNRWSGEKLAEGWVFGEKTDKIHKISSFIVAYGQLTEDIKQYDREQVVTQLMDLLNNTVQGKHHEQ